MRRPVIAGNWKLFKTTDEALELVTTLVPLVKRTDGVDIIVAPVFTVLGSVNNALKDTNIRLSAQNCFWEAEGAYTGEVSPRMLADVGCTHVIIGHSERRQYFSETDGTVNRKLKSALEAGIAPIFCIGETLQEREQEKTFDVIKAQAINGLSGLTREQLDKLIIAYEPVWAIGTGKTATDSQAQEVHAYIRRLIAELFDTKSAGNMRILYGGSVKPENIKGLMAQQDIDGALVGGASLKAESFAAIVNFGA